MLTQKNWMRLDRVHKLKNYKITAEGVKINGHCALIPKMGDKYVFTNGAILELEESTFPGVCLWALAGIYPINLVFIEHIVAGHDPNDILRDQVTCMDLALGSGGLGQVVFKNLL